MSTGKRIKELSHERGLTQQELAKRIGISVSHLSAIENDRVKPSIRLLVRIANSLNVNLYDLTGG